MHGFMLAEGRNTVNTRQDGLGGDIYVFFFIANDEANSSSTMILLGEEEAYRDFKLEAFF